VKNVHNRHAEKPPAPTPNVRVTEVCTRCGAPKDAHVLVNYSDSGCCRVPIWLCPTACYAEPDA
jgi:hypothetical protein